MRIIKEDIFEIDTMESFYGNLILFNNNLIIPYINLGLSDHILNKSDKLKFIDYCYIIAEKINYLKLNKDVIIENNKRDSTAYSLYLGGLGIGDITGIFDMEIQAKKLYLMYFEDYRLADLENMWKPSTYLDSKSNMDMERVNVFIRNKNLALELRRVLEDSFL